MGITLKKLRSTEAFLLESLIATNASSIESAFTNATTLHRIASSSPGTAARTSNKDHQMLFWIDTLQYYIQMKL